MRESLQSNTQLDGVKNIIMQVTYFFKVPMLVVVLLSYIERECFHKRNLATILPLKSKFSENFRVSVLLMEVSKC